MASPNIEKGMPPHNLTRNEVRKAMKPDKRAANSEVATETWSYDEFVRSLKRVVVDDQEIPFAELPTHSIDFGRIAQQTENLATLQTQDLNKAERGQYIGIQNIPPYGPVESQIVVGDETGVNSNPSELFEAEIFDTLDIAAQIHSHLFGVFSPIDILLIRSLQAHNPLIAIGVAPSAEYEPGFTLYALRSSDTKTFLTQKDLATNNSAEDLLASELTIEKLRLRIDYREDTALIEKLRHRPDGSEKRSSEMGTREAEEFNGATDRILRGEVKRHAIALYVAPWGSTVAKRCNPDIPTLDQLLPILNQTA